jgi:hypothetical protein
MFVKLKVLVRLVVTGLLMPTHLISSRPVVMSVVLVRSFVLLVVVFAELIWAGKESLLAGFAAR